MDQTAIGSSSSEATESENSCTERYDYEKKSTMPGNKIKQKSEEEEDEEDEEGEEEGEEGEEEDDDEKERSKRETPRIGDPYDEAPSRGEALYHDLDFLRENNGIDSIGRNLRLHDRYFIDEQQKQQQQQQQQQRLKRNFQRPASLKSVNSYEYRETAGSGRRHFTMENKGQHEHYMIPTHEPNRSNDKRTMSLFNPDFLPNFNDMLMYVGNTGITRDRDYYRCNVDPNEWSNNDANSSILDDRSSNIYDCNDRPDDESSCGDPYNLEQEPDYASIRQMVLDVRDTREQDCENIYAPVGFQGFKSQGRKDFDC
ncbi:MATH and LRR domain-containing protein PFE0570w-like [Venturia canescens]|uniref:MATH and LRR domain-containing protein PFE0570w-like n=1 Tax=Venturia canescens TaxID=32260 RepID=UPI001C9CD85A|nr:MATH and LRR domain-containing protein PFE0570w-like [Venturia canescens]